VTGKERREVGRENIKKSAREKLKLYQERRGDSSSA